MRGREGGRVGWGGRMGVGIIRKLVTAVFTLL